MTSTNYNLRTDAMNREAETVTIEAQHIEEAELKALNNELANLVESDKPMYAIHYGSLYDKDMSLNDVSTAIRSTLRKLSKSKHSPLTGAKVSVRKRHGTAIDVRLTVDYPVHVDEDQESWNRQDGKRWPWLTDKAREAKQIAEDLHNAYNFDGSDTQTDYFHVNYYGSVRIEEA